MLQLREAPAPGGVKVPALALPSGPTMSVRLATAGMLVLCSSTDLQALALLDVVPMIILPYHNDWDIWRLQGQTAPACARKVLINVAFHPASPVRKKEGL